MHISFWKHHPISDQKGDILAQETIDFYNKFKPDFVKITPAGTWIATCYGLEDYYENDFLGRRFVKNTLINSVQDFAKISLFSENPSPLTEQLKAAELVCKEIVEVPVYSTIFSPVNQAIQLCGLENFLRLIQQHPEETTRFLNVLNQNTKSIIKQFVALGIEGIYYATQSCQKSQLPEQVYEAFGKKIDEDCLEFCADLVQSIIVHLHGESVYLNIKENIPFVSIHFEQHPTNNFNSTYPTIKGIPAKIINEITDKKSIQSLIYNYKNNADLFLCGCVLPLDTPDSVIKNWIEAVRQIN
jgi:uroporphyrinogen decarboxylase